MSVIGISTCPCFLHRLCWTLWALGSCKQLTPSITLLFSLSHVNLVPVFAQVSWAWQWLCCLSLVQSFNGNLFYALLSLRGGGEWWLRGKRSLSTYR